MTEAKALPRNLNAYHVSTRIYWGRSIVRTMGPGILSIRDGGVTSRTITKWFVPFKPWEELVNG